MFSSRLVFSNSLKIPPNLPLSKGGDFWKDSPPWKKRGQGGFDVRRRVYFA
jgi:hypothetical protein